MSTGAHQPDGFVPTANVRRLGRDLGSILSSAERSLPAEHASLRSRNAEMVRIGRARGRLFVEGGPISRVLTATAVQTTSKPRVGISDSYLVIASGIGLDLVFTTHDVGHHFGIPRGTSAPRRRRALREQRAFGRSGCDHRARRQSFPVRGRAHTLPLPSGATQNETMGRMAGLRPNKQCLRRRRKTLASES